MRHAFWAERCAGLGLAVVLALGVAGCRGGFLGQTSGDVPANPCAADASPGVSASAVAGDLDIDAVIVNGPAQTYTTPEACQDGETLPNSARITVVCRSMGAIVKLDAQGIMNNLWDRIGTGTDGQPPIRQQWVNEAYLDTFGVAVADCA